MNNEKQLAVAALLYAQENSKQRFSPNDGKGWPIMDLNWLQQAADIPVSVFRCPATKNLQFPKRKQYAEGSFYYFDLTLAALSRDSKTGYSYDLLPWFADMENYWNGNAGSTKNSRLVPKTLGNISSYSHEHEAFGFQGKKTSPDVTWLFVDNDLLSPEPFWPKPTGNHQSKGANAAFADGHVEWVKQQGYVYRYELSQDNNRTKDIPRPRL